MYKDRRLCVYANAGEYTRIYVNTGEYTCIYVNTGDVYMYMYVHEVHELVVAQESRERDG